MSSSVDPCPVCGAQMHPFDTATVLERYAAVYHRCPVCGLVGNLDTPWLEEAYTHAISEADVGLLHRAKHDALLARAVITFEGLRGGRFLDWAAGYGTFTQLMRDKGYDFWQHDEYAEPVFARQYLDDGTSRYDLVTAFEVFEHLPDPQTSLAALGERTDLVLLTTETLPDPAPPVRDWWYYMPEVGQHIRFHTVASLRLLGAQAGFRLTTNGRNWHLYHRGEVDVRTRLALSGGLNRAARRARDTAVATRARLR